MMVVFLPIQKSEKIPLIKLKTLYRARKVLSFKYPNHTWCTRHISEFIVDSLNKIYLNIPIKQRVATLHRHNSPFSLNKN